MSETAYEVEVKEGKTTELLRSVLKSQYHASLAMLRQAVEKCPEHLWYSQEQVNAFWQTAYHTLFFAHLYLQPNEAAFQPWEQHQGQVQHEDGQTGPSDPNSPLPLIPEPYTRKQVLEYWSVCDAMVDPAIDALDLLSSESGFSWYKVSKLEHQIVNVRHIQLGAAQLSGRLRAALNVGVEWVGCTLAQLKPRAVGQTTRRVWERDSGARQWLLSDRRSVPFY
jgi:hypothetical protein